jgi:hypothetical protein
MPAIAIACSAALAPAAVGPKFSARITGHHGTNAKSQHLAGQNPSHPIENVKWDERQPGGLPGQIENGY